MIRITIPGCPATKKNSQRIFRLSNGRMIIKPSAKFEEYQDLAGLYIPGSLRKSIDYPVAVKCLYFMSTRRKVDLVNLLESTCDILVHYHVLLDDNSDIVVSHDGSRVLYDKQNTRAEIEIDGV